MHTQSHDTRASVLARVYRVAGQLPSVMTATAADLQCVVATMASDHVSVRRLYHAVNLAWHHAHAVLSDPLQQQKPGLDPTRAAAASPVRLQPTPRCLTTDEARRLCTAADSISARHACFVRLLLTTGVRVGAVRCLRWESLGTMDPVTGRFRAAESAAVIEKGGHTRWLPLDTTLRSQLEQAWQMFAAVLPAPARVFVFGRPPCSDRCCVTQQRSAVRHRVPIGTRQLREWWYRVCDHAGVTGPHCHPHAARHFVAHRLFANGNSLAIIAKFLGHSSIETTNRHYMRLSFAETMDHIKLPTDLTS